MHFILVVIVLLFAYAVARGQRRTTRFDLFCCWIFMSAYLISPRFTISFGTGVHWLVAGQADSSTEIKGQIAVDAYVSAQCS
jgi:hypothetical protein